MSLPLGTDQDLQHPIESLPFSLSPHFLSSRYNQQSRKVLKNVVVCNNNYFTNWIHWHRPLLGLCPNSVLRLVTAASPNSADIREQRLHSDLCFPMSPRAELRHHFLSLQRFLSGSSQHREEKCAQKGEEPIKRLLSSQLVHRNQHCGDTFFQFPFSPPVSNVV